MYFVIYFLLPQRSFLATDLLDHLPSDIKERASREPLCALPLAESPADVALVLLPYRGLPFPNESFIQVVTLAKALSKQTTLIQYESGWKESHLTIVIQGEVNPLYLIAVTGLLLTEKLLRISLIRKKRASISRATSYTTRRAATISPKEPVSVLHS